MASICRAVLIDLSGTVYVGDNVIPGAVEAFQRLQSHNMKIAFVTNTTKESKEALLSRLISIGFPVQEKEIFTSLSVTRDFIQKKLLRPFLMLEKSALKDFDGIEVKNPNAVVVGLSPTMFNYEDMNKAFKLVTEKSPLIAIHKGRFYKREDGLALGPGPFVAALEYAGGTEAKIMGKPNANFFLSCLNKLECVPSEAVMIGDDVRDDINGAQSIGMRGILVKSGKYRPGDEYFISPPPCHVCTDFPDAVDFIINHMINKIN